MNAYEVAIISALRKREFIHATREVKSISWEEGYGGGCDTCGYGRDESGMEIVYADNGQSTKVSFDYSYGPADLVRDAVEVLSESQEAANV